MKTAISIPDDLFAEAEREAKRSKVSRSRLYAQAMSAFLRAQRQRRLTAATNRALERIGGGAVMDKALEEMQWRTLAAHHDPEDQW